MVTSTQRQAGAGSTSWIWYLVQGTPNPEHSFGFLSARERGNGRLLFAVWPRQRSQRCPRPQPWPVNRNGLATDVGHPYPCPSPRSGTGHSTTTSMSAVTPRSRPVLDSGLATVWLGSAAVQEHSGSSADRGKSKGANALKADHTLVVEGLRQPIGPTPNHSMPWPRLREIHSMPSFDPNTVRDAVAAFTPRRPTRFHDLSAAKEVIVELRQKRASYRAIAELLTQHCLPISKTAVAAFCHEVLGDVVRPRRRAPRKRTVGRQSVAVEDKAIAQAAGSGTSSAAAGSSPGIPAQVRPVRVLTNWPIRFSERTALGRAVH